MITDEKVYFSAWVEEGWDEEKDCATEEYKYYEKVIVRDFKGYPFIGRNWCFRAATRWNMVDIIDFMKIIDEQRDKWTNVKAFLLSI